MIFINRFSRSATDRSNAGAARVVVRLDDAAAFLVEHDVAAVGTSAFP